MSELMFVQNVDKSLTEISMLQSMIREFSVNYYIEPHSGCAWSDDDRYCILVKWDDFVSNPEKYVDMAFEKRTSPVAERVKIRNLR